MTESVIYPASWCYVASGFAVLFCVFGVSGELKYLVNSNKFNANNLLFRKFADDRRIAKMRTFKETRNDRFSVVADFLRSAFLCDHDADASRSLLPQSVDVRRLPLSSVSVCVLQQRLRVDVVNDIDDN